MQHSETLHQESGISNKSDSGDGDGNGNGDGSGAGDNKKRLPAEPTKRGKTNKRPFKDEVAAYNAEHDGDENVITPWCEPKAWSQERKQVWLENVEARALHRLGDDRNKFNYGVRIILFIYTIDALPLPSSKKPIFV